MSSKNKEGKRIPFVYIPEDLAKRAAKNLDIIDNVIGNLFGSLDFDLRSADIKYKKREYITLVLLNSAAIFFIASLLLSFLILAVGERSLQETVLYSLGLGIFLFFLFFFITIRYPKIIGGKKSEQIERNLVFALKDILLQVSAGTSLYSSFVAIANSDYGEVSKEFEKATKKVQSGTPMDKALEEIALNSKSEYMKRTIWQIINVMKSGANIQVSLRVVIDDLLDEHKTKIRSYAQELNMWSLVYMLFAVAIPTIGSTVMLILTSFSGASMTPASFIVFGGICLFVQFALIGLIQSRRPVINI